MKKFISLVLLLVLTFSLAGCSGHAPEEVGEAPPQYMVMVDGVVYHQTGRTIPYNTTDAQPEHWDGQITSQVDEKEVPTQNDQSNFATGIGYRYGEQDGTIIVMTEKNKFRLFATKILHERMEAEDKGQVFEVEATVAWANYSDDSLISDKALNKGVLDWDDEQHIPIYKCDTPKELAAFKADFNGVLELDPNPVYEGTPSFERETAAFNEAFFVDNSLLLVYVEASSGTYDFDVDYVSSVYGKVTVFAEQTNDPEVFDCMMAGWLLSVPVTKEQIKGCGEFDAVLQR